MDPLSLRRSALYTPGSRPSALKKASQSAADVLIFDLEDAVAPEGKCEARDAVAEALADPALSDRTVVVRVNAIGTPWCEDDVSAISRLRPAGLLFPKISSASDASLAEAMLGSCGASPRTELWCMIETPRACLDGLAIGQLALRADSRMTTWVMGTNDLVKDLRARPSPMREGLVPVLTLALLAARASGLRILDGVHNDISDPEGFDATCRQGREMGFDGRTLIHPSQIDACHRAYSPAPDEVEEARQVVEAFSLPENEGKGVIQVGGRMVELLHAGMARETVAIHEAIIRRAPLGAA